MRSTSSIVVIGYDVRTTSPYPGGVSLCRESWSATAVAFTSSGEMEGQNCGWNVAWASGGGSTWEGDELQWDVTILAEYEPACETCRPPEPAQHAFRIVRAGPDRFELVDGTSKNGERGRCQRP